MKKILELASRAFYLMGLAFRPTDKVVEERMFAFEESLRSIAATSYSRFARGNAPMQLGIVLTKEELDNRISEMLSRP